jgi:hypothetical protein
MYTERIIKDMVEKQDGYLVEEVRKVGFDINKEELAKALKYDRDQYVQGYTDGRMYKPPVITNADRVRVMSDEELAEWLTFIEGKILAKQPTLSRSELFADWLDWLKQEAGEYVGNRI